MKVRRDPRKKIMPRQEVAKIVHKMQSEGKTVVFTNGCFDVLHIGHIRILEHARSLGDCLAVGLNSDTSVRHLKGGSRPIIPQNERAEMLAALECVDFVSIFEEWTPDEIIDEIRPDIHVKGGDYTPETLTETAILKKYGGKLVIMPLIEGRSTTLFLEKVARGAAVCKIEASELEAVKEKAIAVIPARMASTRLPNKPLLDICGKPMIQWVYERANSAESVREVLVATPDKEIIDAVEAFGGKAIYTSPEHRSGTDRLAEVAAILPEDALIINVQGDEPLIDPRAIDELAAGLFSSGAVMASLMRKLDENDDPDDPNLVKVVTDFRGYALYFSRSRIPYPRSQGSEVYGHIGIYGFRRDFLMQFARTPMSSLEKSESLEQLRAIENGYGIRMIETSFKPISVDTMEDLERVREALKCTATRN